MTWKQNTLIVAAVVGLVLSLPLDAREHKGGRWQMQQQSPSHLIAKGPGGRGGRKQSEGRRESSDKRYSRGRDHRGGGRQQNGGWRQSLDSAVSNARKRTGGRVVSAETKNKDGREVHFIRILSDDGKVQRLRVDARTGRPISSGKR